MNPQPVSLADELRKLMERLRKSVEAHDAAEEAAISAEDKQFYSGSSCARDEDANLLETLLAQHAPPGEPAQKCVYCGERDGYLSEAKQKL